MVKPCCPALTALMLAPFASASVTTGGYHGSYYSIGYIDDYGALRKLDATCQGTSTCQLKDAKATSDAKAH